jgi:hypothetical protein
MPSNKHEDDSLRLRFFRRLRPASVGEVGAELWQLLSALGALSPRFRQWSTRDAGFRVRRLRSLQDCARNLEGAEIELAPGNRPTHCLVLSCAGEYEQRAELRVLFALEGGPSRWRLGLRVEMRIGSVALGPPEASGDVAKDVALAVVQAIRPYAGFVGTKGEPDPRWDEALEPEAAWMTYLSFEANAAPFAEKRKELELAPAPCAPAPAVVVPVQDLGWLIVAFPGSVKLDNASQRLRIEHARRALGPRVRQEPMVDASPVGEGTIPDRGPHGVEPVPSAALSPWAARANNALAGTSLDVEVPRGPLLPFRPGAALPPMATASDTPSRKPTRDLGGTSLAVGVPSALPLPFASTLDSSATISDRPAAPSEKIRALGARAMELPIHVRTISPAAESSPAPPLPTLEQYASLVVDLADAPERGAETLARYRISLEQRAIIDRHFQDRFAREPGLRATWEMACATYRSWLVSVRR